jgi:hypothetical protein
MPQQDQRASELNHTQKVLGIAFPAAGNAAIVLQPGERPLDLPAPKVAPEWPPILGWSPSAAAEIREAREGVARSSGL